MVLVNAALQYILLVSVICCQFQTLYGGMIRLSHSSAATRNNNNKNLDKRALGTRSCFQRMIKLRGGADIIDTIESLDVKKEMPSGDNCAIVVSTSVGSVFLDKKKRLSIPRNSTVAELKTMIEKKFPGCPPTGLQRLFLGVRALSDDEIIGNITVTSPTPILLDMLSGTSVYNKTLSISQALEAHAALIVQQSYLGSKLLASYSDIPASIATNDSQNIPVQLESGLYRDMFDSVNRTLYETYAEDIAEALERETEPETATDDTAAWRGKRTDTTPLTAALAKEFDLNMRGIRSFFYYSILLGIFAFYGTTSLVASQFLLLLVPFMWISKLRQLRLVFKIFQYLVLPLIPHIEFLMPLLPAPQQVIAIESAKWSSSEMDTPEGMPILPQSKQNRPVVPQSKQNRGLDGLITMLMEGVNRLLASGEEEVDAKEELGVGLESESNSSIDEDALVLGALGKEDQTEGDEGEDEEGEEEGEGDEDNDEIEEDEDFAEDDGDGEEEGEEDGEDIEDNAEEGVEGEVDGEGEGEEMDEDFRDD